MVKSTCSWVLKKSKKMIKNGISEKEIEEFYNGEYKYIKTEERVQELNKYFNGDPVVRNFIYDKADTPEKR